jgi:4-amino-4-deoxy-L-arabinose transferase-like glycosyltransferase
MINLLLGVGILLTALYFVLAKKDFVKSIYYLIPLVPLDNRIYFDFGFARATPVRWAILGVVLSFVFLNFRKINLADIKTRVLEDKVLGILLFVWAFRLLSLIWSWDIKSSLEINLFFTEIVLIYVLVKNAFDQKKEEFLFKALKIYFGIGTALAFWSPIQYYFYKFQDRILPGVWPLINSPVRVGSLFWDINHYGVFSAGVLFIGIAHILSSKSKRAIFGLLAPLFMILISFGMTLSRSAFLGFSAGFIFFILGCALARKYKLLIIGGVFLGTLAFGGYFLVKNNIVVVPKKLYERFFSLNFSYRVWDDSINAHSALILGSWQILEDNPVIGGGYGSFDKRFRNVPVSKSYFDLDPVKDAKIPAHSFIFEPLSATGFIGGVPFYALMALFLIAFWRHSVYRLKFNESPYTSLGVFCALLSVFVSGVFYSYNLEFFYFLFFIGIFLCNESLGKIFPSYKTIAIVTFLVTLSGSFIFYKLGRSTLADWDESIYAQISHNILHIKGDLFAFVWREDALRDGNGLWFEKPPLYIWLTSFVYFTFGVNEFSARFVSAMSGIIGVLIVFLFGKKVFGERVGVLSACVLATTTHWIFQSRNGTLDVLTAFWILCSMYFFFLSERNSKSWKWVGVFLGLVTITKGPVVIIPIVSISVFSLIDRFCYKKSFYNLKDIFVAIVAFFLVSAPWHIIEIIRFGREFLDSYFFYHILERSKGIEEHQNGFWWYFIVLKVWFRQWFVVLIPAFAYAVYSFFASKIGREEKRPLLFLAIWSFVTFIVLSASSSKIQWYIIPIYPPLSVIIGWFLDKAVSFISVKIQSSKFKLQDFVIRVVCLSMLVSCSVYLLIKWKHMWFSEDANRDIAVLGSMVSELNDIPGFLPRQSPIYFYNTSPGPAYYYIQRYARPVAGHQIEDMVKSSNGKAFMALAPESSYKKLVSKYPNPRVTVYYKENDYVLFGKDWVDVRSPFSPQKYVSIQAEYDPFYFEKEMFGSKWFNENSND